jgi:hypothetical protein
MQVVELPNFKRFKNDLPCFLARRYPIKHRRGSRVLFLITAGAADTQESSYRKGGQPYPVAHFLLRALKSRSFSGTAILIITPARRRSGRDSCQ